MYLWSIFQVTASTSIYLNTATKKSGAPFPWEETAV